jgi:predicted transcriptional regulator of viral defense system
MKIDGRGAENAGNVGAERFVYLTAAEQKIFALLPKERAVTTGSLHAALKTVSFTRLSSLLGRLARKGFITKVEKGIYLASENKAFLDYKRGLALGGKSSYVAFSSALSLHHLISERPATIFIATPKANKKASWPTAECRLIALGGKCFGAVLLNGLRVSSVPKTFFDCFARLRYAGGLSKLVEALESSELSEAEWLEFGNYLQEFGSNSLRQRVGFVFNKLCSRKTLSVPPRVLRELEKSVKRSKTVAILDASATRKGVMNSKWRVLVNAKV